MGKLRVSRNLYGLIQAILKMRTELKAKFIQHLSNKKGEKGFTLVELLVVIIIIGILAAIALPNFLNQSAKAKQTEAKQNVGVSNRYQAIYRSENSTFADTFDKLAIGTLSGGAGASTTSYSYTLSASTDNASLIATSSDTSLKSYSGGNNIYMNTSSKNVITAVLCEATTAGLTVLNPPTFNTSTAPVCPSSTIQLGN